MKEVKICINMVKGNHYECTVTLVHLYMYVLQRTCTCMYVAMVYCTVVSLMQQIYEAATKQKSWDSFTKAQRKTITQWKEHSTVSYRVATEREGGGGEGGREGERERERERVKHACSTNKLNIAYLFA